MNRFFRHGLRHGHDIQAQLGFSAHGVHVGQGVGGRDLAKEIGVVRDRRKKVHRLHQRQLVADLVDRRVVALVKAHQQIGVAVDPDTLQQLAQNPRAHLRAAPGALCQLCQLDILFFHG